jgi:PAS domain S-box-containing protein
MGVSEPLIQTSLLGEAVDQGPALIFVADEDMRYVAVNQRACDLLGYTREELLALRVPEVAPGPEAAKRFARIVAEGKLEGIEQLRRKDGSELVLRYLASETRIAGITFYVSIGWPENELN